VGEAKRKKEALKQEQALVEREKSGFFLKKNIDTFEKMGWDKNGIAEKIHNSPEIIVPIEKNIVLQGVKNPLCTVFVGFSTQLLLNALKRKKKIVRYVMIIEPNLSVFKHLIMTEDISDLLLDPAIDFIVGQNGAELMNAMMKCLTTMMDNMEVILDPFQHNTPELVEAGKGYVELIQDTLKQVRLSMGCSDDQYRRFELMIENKKVMYDAWRVSGLWGKFSDVPAFVLGGGPSLDTFIQAFKANPLLANSIIIASDAVLFKLLSSGIKPHIVTRCERKLTNIFKGVTKEMTGGIYYAAYPWTPSEFFRLFDNHFYLFRNNGVCLFTELSHGFVDGGVSAANAGMELAVNFGCKNIILSGIDLCFIDGKSHTADTQVEFNPEKSKAKWSKITDNSGNETTTIPVWERCLNEYAQSIDKHRSKGGESKFWNIAEKGAAIPFTEYCNVKDIDNKIDFKPIDIKSILDLHRSKLPKEETDAFDKKLISTIKELGEFINTIDIANDLAKDAKRSASGEISKLVETAKVMAKEPYDLIKILRQNQANLDKLWTAVAEAYDNNFKNKLYPELSFRMLIFDVLQLDVYHYENATNSLMNGVEFLDERCERYAQLTMEFLVKVKIYLNNFINLFQR
jgi:hypothetical protein